MAIFNLLSFLQTFTPGRQMRPAEKPTGVFFFRDPQETCTPQLPLRLAALLGAVPSGLRGIPPLPGLAPAIPSPPLSSERMLTPEADLDVTR